MNHSQYYQANTAYAVFLSALPEQMYQKYIDHLWVDGGKTLDVGCGVGAAVRALTVRGGEIDGIDPCEPAIERARHGPGTFWIGEATALPFQDASFDSVGSFTVLEHTSQPEVVLREMVRVLKPGGRIVVACPNFLRVVGLSAHHWHNRGPRQKMHNLATLARKMWWARFQPERMAFDHMPAVIREGAFEPDDDAITVTNAVDIAFFLRPTVRITYRSGLLTYSGPRLDRLAEMPVVRTLIGNVFLVGERVAPASLS